MLVLLVDDRPINLKLLRVIFQSAGHDVQEASDGLEALKALEKAPFDVIVSDILMPNMDGYALCRKVRQDPRWVNLSFLIYTSTYVSPGDRDFALQCGADAYLVKPTPAEQILAAVAEARQKRKNSSANDAQVVESAFLKQYNEVLIHKLEEKNLELQKRTEELEESGELFRGLVENLEQVFFLTGPQGRPFLYVSPAYEVVFGRSCQSLYENPSSWLDAIVPEDRTTVQGLRETRPEGYTVEYRIKTSAGDQRWIRARVFSVRDRDGVPVGLRGLAEDITAFKQVELQFHHAQKMESIGRLAGGVAHDFNNLLTAIMGFNSLAMLRTDADHPSQTDLNQVDGLVKRAAELTQQLLAFSRRQVFQPEVVDLNQLIRSMEKMLAPLIGEDTQMVFVPDPSLSKVFVDRGQLEQVVVNLCVNARDAMPRGGHLTLITRRTRFQESWMVELSVSDTGEGIEPSILPQIFEPFFTTKGVGSGTGLGLSTCYGIIQQSGGQILVESQVGEGSTFRVLLPETNRTPSEVRADHSSPARGSGEELILIVEDEQAVGQVTERLLRGNGYSVLVASSSDEAVELVKADQPHTLRLVLTDVVMPGRNGKDLAMELRSLRPDLKVVFMSGYADAVLTQGMEDLGENFLRKPFTPSALLRAIRNALDREI